MNPDVVNHDGANDDWSPLEEIVDSSYRFRALDIDAIANIGESMKAAHFDNLGGFFSWMAALARDKGGFPSRLVVETSGIVRSVDDVTTS